MNKPFILFQSIILFKTCYYIYERKNRTSMHAMHVAWYNEYNEMYGLGLGSNDQFEILSN